MKIVWCKKCVLPNTRPNIIINKDGICNACINHNSKKNIDWKARKKQLDIIVKKAKKSSGKSNYDCIVPVSGGKDSTWQIIKCLQLGLKPLAVTWKTPGRTKIGSDNLSNLIFQGVDHIDWQINPKIEAKFMLKSLKKYGSTAIPMHFSIFNIPIRIAVQLNIPYVIYGENSAFEYGNINKKELGFELNRNWINRYGVTQGTTINSWFDKTMKIKDMLSYLPPSNNDLKKSKVKAIFLGHYIQWDPKDTKNFASRYGFRFPKKPKTGFYNYADIDDDFISIHHWLKWYKFGFTRLYDNLSIEIRNKRITRNKAIEIIKKDLNQPPKEDIKKFCKFVKITYKEFFKIAEKHRNKKIWIKNKSNKWCLNNSLF